MKRHFCIQVVIVFYFFVFGLCYSYQMLYIMKSATIQELEVMKNKMPMWKMDTISRNFVVNILYSMLLWQLLTATLILWFLPIFFIKQAILSMISECRMELHSSYFLPCDPEVLLHYLSLLLQFHLSHTSLLSNSHFSVDTQLCLAWSKTQCSFTQAARPSHLRDRSSILVLSLLQVPWFSWP